MNLLRSLSIASLLSLSAIAATACSSSSDAKEAPTDEASSDLVVKNLRVAGSLVYGQTSGRTAYNKKTAKYTAFTFAGHEGDQVDIWVKSTNGDTVAWLLDGTGKTLAKNDDASFSTLDSHIAFTLPASAAASATYYIAVRDYWRDPMSFKVTLDGKPADLGAGCNTDADCVKIHETCCDNLGWTSVLASNEKAYTDSLACDEHPICPMIATLPDYSAAECNQTTHTCELVQPKDIACGGFVAPPAQHQCPAGYQCRHDAGANPDVPGSCVQSCGGFAGFACHDPEDECVDDPSDGCDPAKGGADCGGICTPKAPSDCRATGCAAGRFCSFCWGSYACIPDGAAC
jgi:hypothetical protein